MTITAVRKPYSSCIMDTNSLQLVCSGYQNVATFAIKKRLNTLLLNWYHLFFSYVRVRLYAMNLDFFYSFTKEKTELFTSFMIWRHNFAEKIRKFLLKTFRIILVNIHSHRFKFWYNKLEHSACNIIELPVFSCWSSCSSKICLKLD